MDHGARCSSDLDRRRSAHRPDPGPGGAEICCGSRTGQTSVALHTSFRSEQQTAGIRPERQGHDVGAAVALARRVSPFRGNQHLGLALALVKEMPHTLRALSTGRLSEWRATLLVRETATLSLEDRREVDERIGADAGRVEGWGDRRLVAEASTASTNVCLLRAAHHARWLRCRQSSGHGPPSFRRLAMARVGRRSRRQTLAAAALVASAPARGRARLQRHDHPEHAVPKEPVSYTHLTLPT